MLGFFLFMKAQADAQYTLIYNGGEDPNTFTFETITDASGNPLIPLTNYLFMLSARNIVGTSQNSTLLTVAIPYLLSASQSQISGSGISQIAAAVQASVTILAFDDSGTKQTTGGALYFLQVENTCLVTTNYRCDLSLTNSNYTQLPQFTQMTD